MEKLNTVRSKILSFLRENGDSTVKDIKEGLCDCRSVGTISAVLHEMKKSNKVRSIKRGVYGLTLLEEAKTVRDSHDKLWDRFETANKLYDKKR